MKTTSLPLLIPVRKQRSLPGTFSWSKTPILSTARDVDTLALQQLVDDLKRHKRIRAKIAYSATGVGDLTIQRDPSIKGKEAYRLVVKEDGITIKASSDTGVYYAIQTLRDMLHISGNTIECCQIDDFPDFKRRGIYYDVARGKVPHIETLKSLIERLAHWKLNEFQIYIKNTFTWASHPNIGKGFSPYTPADILEIQAHCRLHNIRFVPSIATLSHSELTLQLPEYRHLAELPGFHGWEGGTMLCPTDPKSLKLTKELHNEFLPLFESTDVNLCCDEPWELGRGRSKRAADRTSRGEVYLNFLLKIHKNCEKLGKRMNIWGDIVLKYPELIKKLPKNVVMLNWDYSATGGNIPRTKEFVDAGLPVIACPGTSGWQRHGTDLPNAIGNVSNFARTAKKYGIDGILNTDWGDFGHRNPLGVSLHGYAHSAAHSWNTKAVDDEIFTEIFAKHVFNDVERMPDAIKILGECASLPLSDSRGLYHTLVEPLRLPTNRFLKSFKLTPLVSHYPNDFPNFIDQSNPDALRTVTELLSQKDLWPKADATLPQFEKRAFADYKLAATMDLISSQHAILGQAYRSGAPLPSVKYSDWADAMTSLMQSFAENWNLRNRPSRLAENLKLMRLAEKECRQIAKTTK